MKSSNEKFEIQGAMLHQRVFFVLQRGRTEHKKNNRALLFECFLKRLTSAVMHFSTLCHVGTNVFRNILNASDCLQKYCSNCGDCFFENMQRYSLVTVPVFVWGSQGFCIWSGSSWCFLDSPLLGRFTLVFLCTHKLRLINVAKLFGCSGDKHVFRELWKHEELLKKKRKCWSLFGSGNLKCLCT